MPNLKATEAFTVGFLMYCGDGTGADGLCVNIGGNDLGGRVGENGVTQGVAVCFDEWANSGDHGVAIYYNAGQHEGHAGDTSRAGAIWENIGEEWFCEVASLISSNPAIVGISAVQQQGELHPCLAVRRRSLAHRRSVDHTASQLRCDG